MFESRTSAGAIEKLTETKEMEKLDAETISRKGMCGQMLRICILNDWTSYPYCQGAQDKQLTQYLLILR